MQTRLSRGLTAVIALSLVAAGCGVTGLSSVATLCAAAAFNVKVILGNGVGGWSGQNAAGVSVTVEPLGGVATTKTTDAGGCASFDSAPIGIYDVSAVPPSSLPASSKKIRDLNVTETGREIVLWLTHRLPTDALPARPVSGAYSHTMTGTLLQSNGNPQPGDNIGSWLPGELGIVAYGGFGPLCTSCTDIADPAGNWTVTRTGLSNDRPALTHTLFAGNFDGTTAGGMLGITSEHFTQYGYTAAVHLVGPGPTAFGSLMMQNVTGSQATSLDAQGSAFVAGFADGISITDVFLYSAIHSLDLWLATVYHDSAVTSVTTPFPQISLDQSVYRYGIGFAGSLSGGFFGQTTTFLVTGAPTLNISYLPRPGDPLVGGGSQPTITWTASSAATAYEIDILNSLMQLVFVGATSTSLSITLPNALAAGSYTVQIFAFDSLASRDFIGGAGRGQGGNSAIEPMGSVFRPGDFQIQGFRGDRKQAAKRLETLVRNFRRGGPLRSPQLDRTPLSNNDDRVSWSNAVAFTR